MKTPCELVAKSVLPTIRADVAVLMIEEHGMTQKETAKLMGITTAAVSQYLSRKRATSRNLDPFTSAKFDRCIREAARTIASKPDNLEIMRAFCRCCMHVRAEKILCDLHREIAPELREDCEHCLALECNF